MAQGRCSANVSMLVLVLIGSLMLPSDAASYVVGGANGWTFNTAAWTKGKRFAVGDTLVFNYSPAVHNVVAVNQAGFVSCRPSRGARVFKSGKDQIKLVKGQNFFICTFPGHCSAGMKIAITV